MSSPRTIAGASGSAGTSGSVKIPFGFDDVTKTKDGCAWFQGDKLYFSPNTKQPVNVPPFHPPSWDPQVGDLDLDFFFTPQWYRGKFYAWLGMVPRSVAPSQYGSVFEMFKDYNLPTTAEEITKGRYIVPHGLQQRWKACEDQIGSVLGVMFEHSSIASAQVLSMPTPERMGGYTRVHKSEKVALRQAYLSRQWFLVHLGTLLYSCMRAWRYKAIRDGKEVAYRPKDFPSAQMTQDRRDEQIQPLEFLPLWFIRVAAIRRDLVPFLSLLRFTFSNFLTLVYHVGMFFRIEDILELGNLGFFIEHRVPIGYPWGDEEEEYVLSHPQAACYRPPIALIQAAIAKKQQKAAESVVGPQAQKSDGDNADVNLVDDYGDANANFGVDLDFANQPAPSELLAPDRPPTPSTAEPGNTADSYTMQEFFQLRAIVGRVRLEEETPEQRRERMLKRQTPTRNTRLFYWRPNSMGAMIRLRIASRWRTVLESPDSEYQKRYDPWYDNVDYAKDFDLEPSDVISSSTETLRSADLDRLDYQMREAYRRRIPEIEGPELEEESWMDDSAVDVATVRFGFVATRDDTRKSQDEADRIYHRIHEALQLYHATSAASVCPPDILPFVATLDSFLNAFKPGTREDGELDPDGIQGPDRDLWDIHPYATSLRSNGTVNDLVRLDDNHILLGQPEDCSWSLVVTNNIDALHACRLRQNGFSLRKVALHFLDRGIPFRAMIQVNKNELPHRRTPRLTPSAIEIRLEGYEWGENDYKEYCRLRRATLLRPGVGFAAFQRGGIVWRIAREELGKLPVAIFQAGPDISGGVEVSSDIPGWLDNRLTSETVAAICGVYHVPLVPQVELERLSNSQDESVLDQLIKSSDVQPNNVAPPDSPGATLARASVRFTPYPSSTGGPSTRAPIPASRPFSVRGDKRYPLARLSWFPTPETLSAARKGNLGHWTGKMEMMWDKRTNEITNLGGVPKRASGWADLSFGSMGKHLWRGVTTASDLAMK